MCCFVELTLLANFKGHLTCSLTLKTCHNFRSQSLLKYISKFIRKGQSPVGDRHITDEYPVNRTYRQVPGGSCIRVEPRWVLHT